MADVISGQRCGEDNCRSRRYRIEDGQYVCIVCGTVNTSLKQSFVEDEENRLTGHVAKTKREAIENVPKILHGLAARALFLEAYQFILSQQCREMIIEKGFPEELEDVVRGLWALRLRLIPENSVDSTVDPPGQHSSQARDKARRLVTGKSKRRLHGVDGQKLPTLLQTLGLLYLSALILRLPVSVGDVYRWATREEIPFIRAIRCIPPKIRNGLPAHYKEALDTQTLLQPDHLRRTCHHLVNVYRDHFQIQTAPLNWPLFLFKYTTELALPANVYLATRDLIQLLNINLQFSKNNQELTLLGFPEIQLISILTIAVKLYHPFDLTRRSVDGTSNPATLAIDWKAWGEIYQDSHGQRDFDQSLKPGDEIRITDKDVPKMSSLQLEQYLNWYEKTWVADTARPGRKGMLSEQLLDMFPISSEGLLGSRASDQGRDSASEMERVEDRLKRVQGSLKLRAASSIDPDENTTLNRRVGELYKRYQVVEEPHPYALAFYTAAADIVGISVSSLSSAVLQMESHIVRWRRSQRQKSKEESNSEDNSRDISGDEA